MESDKIFHDWLVIHLKTRLAKDYTEIAVNLDGERQHALEGHYPNLILKHLGMVMAVVEVETEGSITPDKVKQWKGLLQAGTRLIVMVPERAKAKVTSLLWDTGIASDVSVGSYDIKINMP
ncbi:hypothetical protein MBAV_004924 [Candidatus Magnetobacterium bavaricum]|uniref:Uncharacterized protein n=1 Tax=Candidatus Magnetobacterium bavaricum TaxID=29290 RepID=A0A0F3GLP0_9BACT|nr:hypothetical protein MBAV_004924 [Candidatus Magnetobacterium bavaricum]